jgi:hypothetical protein
VYSQRVRHVTEDICAALYSLRRTVGAAAPATRCLP